MLDKVKQKLEASKEPLVPISLRIENSSKTALTLLAVNYGVKTNELIRYIFQAFIEEASNELLDAVKINSYFEANKDAGYLISMDKDHPLHEVLVPFNDGQIDSLRKMGFKVQMNNKDLGDQ